jgi:hypothetical protein
MPTAEAARDIVAAIDAGRREAIITGHGKVFVFLYRHFPWLLRAIFRVASSGGFSTRKR